MDENMQGINFNPNTPELDNLAEAINASFARIEKDAPKVSEAINASFARCENIKDFIIRNTKRFTRIK